MVCLFLYLVNTNICGCLVGVTEWLDSLLYVYLRPLKGCIYAYRKLHI